MNVVFIKASRGLWGSVFLAVAAETQMSAGYVAKAIWLAMHSEPGKKKSPIVQTRMEENLDVSTLFIVKCVAHIKKKCSGIFCLLALKTYLCSQVSDRILSRKCTKPLVFLGGFLAEVWESLQNFLENSGRCCTSSECNCSFFLFCFFFVELECERPEGADVERWRLPVCLVIAVRDVL